MILQDSGNNFWSITVDDSGLLHSTQVGAGVVTPVLVNDPSNATTWQIGITTGGLLTTTSVSLSLNPTFILLISATRNTAWNFQVTSQGLITTSPSEYFSLAVPSWVSVLGYTQLGDIVKNPRYDSQTRFIVAYVLLLLNVAGNRNTNNQGTSACRLVPSQQNLNALITEWMNESPSFSYYINLAAPYAGYPVVSPPC